MGLGKKFINAIASSFIEVRLGPEDASPACPVDTLSERATPSLAERIQYRVPDLRVALGAEGELNDGVIYAAATLTSVPFTAEQAIHVLEELPKGVTASSLRCAAMHEALSVLGDDLCAVTQQVVSDAAQKMVAINQYLTKTSVEVKGFRRELVEEMDELHERLNQLRLLLEDTSASHQLLEDAGRARVDNLTGVIAFFDEFHAYLRAPAAERTDPDELPAFLREETAFKILGVTRKNAA